MWPTDKCFKESPVAQPGVAIASEMARTQYFGVARRQRAPENLHGPERLLNCAMGETTDPGSVVDNLWSRCGKQWEPRNVAWGAGAAGQ